MCNYKPEELQEIFQMLERAGMNPMWCDTPVPYFDVNVQAGLPTGIGHASQGEYLMFPRELVKLDATVVFNVRGDSMKDADLADGDQVSMELGEHFTDGDIVVASIDDEYTVKTYFVDQQGEHWLVPMNDNYKPIHLTEEMNVRIYGRVTNIMKMPPRIPYRELVRCVENKRARIRTEEQAVSPSCEMLHKDNDTVSQAIKGVQPLIREKGHWLAIFRILADEGIVHRYTELAPYVHNTLHIDASQLSKPIDPAAIGKAAISKGLRRENPFTYWENAKSRTGVTPFYRIAKRFKELMVK